ncbi:MAG: MFS transporter [Chloroflexi bacterium]|nr:MFS transporter [Chloroflexota bacterium]
MNARALLNAVVRSGIYYGWAIVLVAFLAGFVKSGFTGFLFGVFLKPMSEDFGWSRSLTAGAVTFGTVAAALLGFSFGSILDRYGARALIVGGAVLMGLAFAALSQVQTVAQFYIAYIVGRLMAQGPLGDALLSAAVSQWFVRMRGRAVALTAMGAPAGGAVLALVAERVISVSSWRYAWLLIGVVTWVLVLVPAWFWVRRRPEDMGLLPDGDKRDVAQPAFSQKRGLAVRPALVVAEEDWTARGAVRTRTFWLLAGGGFLHGVVASAVVFNMVASLTDREFSPTLAVGALSLYALLQAVTQLGWGLIAERVPIHIAYGASQFLTLAGIPLIGTASSPLVLYTGTVVFGLGQGGVHTLSHVVWPIYFGRRYLGSIRGLSLLLETMGNAFGPVLGALVYDIWGSYAWAFVGAAVIQAIVAAMVYGARRPHLGRASPTAGAPA